MAFGNTATSAIRRLACERCWKRKQKCDRKDPTCTLCKEAGTPCRPRTINGNDPDDTILAGESYVQTLKRNIAQLDSQRQDKRQRTGSPSFTAPVAPSSANQLGNAHDATENRSVHSALAELTHFGLNTTPRDQTGTQSSARPFSLWSLTQRAISWAHTGSIDFHVSQDELPPLLELRNFSLDLIISIVKDYEKHVLRTYPFIASTALRRHHEYFVDEGFEATGNYSALLVAFIISTGFNKNGASPSMELLALQARSALLQLCTNARETDAVSLMQCLVAAALNAVYGINVESASYLIGLTLAKAIALGFYRTQSQDLSQEKWRVMSVLYVMDSFVLGQPAQISDGDVSPEIFEPKQDWVGEDIRLLKEQLEHARLITTLRRSTGRPAMYFTTAYESWCDSTTLKNFTPSATEGSDPLFLQLRTRFHVVAFQHLRTVSNEQSLRQKDRNAKAALHASHEWLQSLERRQDEKASFWSILDAYEITAAAIMCTCLQSGIQDMPEGVLLCPNVQLLALSLLSYLSARCPVATIMRKAVSTMCNAQRINIEHEGEKKLPRKLRDLLQIYNSTLAVAEG
ncbi:hypothetical protein CKM354_001111700 [Cercospora kikuchii]|uniref:Zn(2)-C6 fungal-type domain-containing protein n=1 Tax=Cercospora kikuchii TaxID=84275 RepID=A0A9P3CRM7_9PEZI|nr:uncharacterized protein CKM354_001111700 [Cercospora kikuchii]GIZ48042.1 hypothetical protein CKM354_001111700 [Cercospora kikuchii]